MNRFATQNSRVESFKTNRAVGQPTAQRALMGADRACRPRGNLRGDCGSHSATKPKKIMLAFHLDMTHSKVRGLRLESRPARLGL
jgi:hypothetical protein